MRVAAPSLQTILRRIRAPVFPRRTYDIARYGATADRTTNCGPSIAQAIAECHAAGGGHVLVPPGGYLIRGPIRLRSNVDFHLSDGATIRFGTDPADYLPPVLVRWEGTFCYNYCPLIFADREQNIALTGRGVLDGQARRAWGDWKAKQSRDQHELREMGRRRTPLARRVFGSGHYLRPSLFEPHRCRNVLVEGITLKGSPFWTVHPVLCTNVVIRGVHVLPGTTNDDACDPDSCEDVLIEDCRFESADDSIAIKAGRDQDAWGRPGCSNIVVRRCTAARSRASAFAIGSEMSGGVRNVFVRDCTVGRVREHALYVKSNSDRGGRVENLRVRGVHVGSCASLVSLETEYKGVRGHPYPARYRDFLFEEITCRRTAGAAILSNGSDLRPIERLVLRDIAVERAATPVRIRQTHLLRVENVIVNGRPLPPSAAVSRPSRRLRLDAGG